MIELYSGTPGSGKSLHVAEKIYYALRAGRTVITNFDINKLKIKRCKGILITIDNWDISPEALEDLGRQHIEIFGRKEDSLLLVLDECQILFNARSWQEGGRLRWLSFFSQHRKYNYHIILVAQYDGMIDKQIRTLIEYENVHRKVSNFGKIGTVFNLAFGGGLFVCVRYWYPLSERLSSEFFKFKKRYARIYDTYTMFCKN